MSTKRNRIVVHQPEDEDSQYNQDEEEEEEDEQPTHSFIDNEAEESDGQENDDEGQEEEEDEQNQTDGSAAAGEEEVAEEEESEEEMPPPVKQTKLTRKQPVTPPQSKKTVMGPPAVPGKKPQQKQQQHQVKQAFIGVERKGGNAKQQQLQSQKGPVSTKKQSVSTPMGGGTVPKKGITGKTASKQQQQPPPAPEEPESHEEDIEDSTPLPLAINSFPSFKWICFQPEYKKPKTTIQLVYILGVHGIGKTTLISTLMKTVQTMHPNIHASCVSERFGLIIKSLQEQGIENIFTVMMSGLLPDAMYNIWQNMNYLYRFTALRRLLSEGWTNNDEKNELTQIVPGKHNIIFLDRHPTVDARVYSYAQYVSSRASFGKWNLIQLTAQAITFHAMFDGIMQACEIEQHCIVLGVDDPNTSIAVQKMICKRGRPEETVPGSYAFFLQINNFFKHFALRSNFAQETKQQEGKSIEWIGLNQSTETMWSNQTAKWQNLFARLSSTWQPDEKAKTADQIAEEVENMCTTMQAQYTQSLESFKLNDLQIGFWQEVLEKTEDDEEIHEYMDSWKKKEFSLEHMESETCSDIKHIKNLMF